MAIIDQATTTYKNHTIALTIERDNNNQYSGTVAVSGQYVNVNESVTGQSQQDVSTQLGTKIQGIKQQIDSAIQQAQTTGGDTTGDTTGGTTGGTTGDGTGGVTGDNNQNVNGTGGTNPAPAPQSGDGIQDPPQGTIEFGGSYSQEYMDWRNNEVAAALSSDMTGPYANENEAKLDFLTRIKSYPGTVNLTWDTNFGITDPDWANTITKIRTLFFSNRGIGNRSGMVTPGTNNGGDGVDNTSTATGTGTGESGTGMVGDIPATGNVDVNNGLEASQDLADDLNNQQEQVFQTNLSMWQDQLGNVSDFSTEIGDRVNLINQSFQDSANYLKSASDLSSRAQKIYSNDNINRMKQKLISQGFDPAKAGPAVYFKALKDSAQLQTEVYKIQSDFDKTLAQLEQTRGQLVDGIKKEGITNKQWAFDQISNIDKQIENLRQQNRTIQQQNTMNLVAKPMLDIMSGQRQAELQQITKKYENNYLNANPSEKLVAAARIFGSDWAYVDNDIVSYTNLPFGQLLAKAAQSIRENKTAAETGIAAAGADNETTYVTV